jgi:ketosteroid isomerase-like protein
MAEHEIRSLIQEVGKTFGRDVDAWLACFAEPLVVATSAGTMVLDLVAARAMGTQMFDELRERDFDHTELQEAAVTVVAEDIGVAHASFIRRRADGSVLEPVEATYLCRKRADGWKVVTLAPAGAPPS